jgi:4-hydroxybenzoate polyprenyltransferase
LNAWSKRFSDLIVFDNVFISICAMGLFFVSQVSFHHSLSLTPAALFVFFATLLVYNLHKSLSLLRQQTVREVLRLLFSENLTVVVRIFIFSGLAGMSVTFFLLQPAQRLPLIILGAITLAYSFPIIRIGANRRRFREIFFIKIFLISIVWAFATVWLAAMDFDVLPDDIWLLFAERTLFVFAITIPFEIRDMEQEKRWGNTTLPVVLGIKVSKRLAWFCLFLFCALVAWHRRSFGMKEGVAIAMAISALAAAWTVYLTHEDKNHFFYKFFVDGTMLLQFIFVVLCN